MSFSRAKYTDGFFSSDSLRSRTEQSSNRSQVFDSELHSSPKVEPKDSSVIELEH